MVIGICGKSGSGKTTISDYLSTKGFIHINLDREAKLMYSQNEVKSALISAFGSNIYKNGNLDKDLLSKIVFGKRENLEKLNQIFYPRLFKLVSDMKEKGVDTVVDGAIIFDAKIDTITDRTIFVKADKDTLLKRLSNRENRDIEILKGRLEAQSFIDKFENRSDFVIDTSKGDVFKEIDLVIKEIEVVKR